MIFTILTILAAVGVILGILFVLACIFIALNVEEEREKDPTYWEALKKMNEEMENSKNG